MDFVINVYSKIEGLTPVVLDLLPLLGAVGGLLGVASSLLIRAGSSHSPAEAWHAIHPTANEIATFSLSLGVLRAHFKHNENSRAIASLGTTATS